MFFAFQGFIREMWVTAAHEGRLAVQRGTFTKGLSGVGEPSADLKDNVEEHKIFRPFPSLLPVFDMSGLLAVEKT